MQNGQFNMQQYIQYPNEMNQMMYQQQQQFQYFAQQQPGVVAHPNNNFVEPQNLNNENVQTNENETPNHSKNNEEKETINIATEIASSSADTESGNSSNSVVNNSTVNTSQTIIPKTWVAGICVPGKPIEVMSVQEEVEIPEGPYYSLLVECVAVGHQHTDRAVAHVALVENSEDHNVVLNLYIKPSREIVSYLTPINNLTEEILNEYGLETQEALGILRRTIPKDAVLIGHNVARHITRLGLKKGVDFRCSLDLTDCWRVWNKNFMDYTKFSLQHESLVLLRQRISGNVPNDAILAMRIFQQYLRERGDPRKLHSRRIELMETPIERAKHKLFPSIEGVCMGIRKSCTCGAPFEDWTD